jgi:hypothetical protein
MTKPLAKPMARLLASPRVSMVEALGAEAPHLLFFTGDPERRVESVDVAIIAEQLLSELPELRVGVVTRDAEKALRDQYGVTAVPSVVSPSSGRVLPKVASWTDYRALAAEALEGGTS